MGESKEPETTQAALNRHNRNNDISGAKESHILEDIELGSEADKNVRIEKIYKSVTSTTSTESHTN